MQFVKEVHKAGLFVHLRIGPYACAEWNYGLVFLSVFFFICTMGIIDVSESHNCALWLSRTTIRRSFLN